MKGVTELVKVVWDWNGTLLNDVRLNFDSINFVLKKYGLSPMESVEQYRNVFAFPVKKMYEALGFDFSKTDWDTMANDFMDYYMERSGSLSLAADAIAALNLVARRRGDSIILSASKAANLKRQIAQFPALKNFISAVYGLDDIYAHSKKGLALEFKSTCMDWDDLYVIGDTLHDLEIADTIGAKCILVGCGHQAREKLEASKAVVKDSLMEAVQFIYERSHH